MQITLLQIFENFLPQIGINLFASASGVLVLALAGVLHGATPTALALSALTTGFATFAIAYYMSLPYKANLKPSGLWNRYVSDYLKFLLPILAGQVVIISFTLVDQLMASFLPVGNISALNYASLLYNLPITLFAVPITSVLYPAISSASAKMDWPQQASAVSRGIQLIWLIVLPFSGRACLACFTHCKTGLHAWSIRHNGFHPNQRGFTVLRFRDSILGLAKPTCHCLSVRER